jgi:manganese transport protein
MAIGLHLLTGIPLTWGVIITVLDTLLLLFYAVGRAKNGDVHYWFSYNAGPASHQNNYGKTQPCQVVAVFVPHLPNDRVYIAIGVNGAM